MTACIGLLDEISVSKVLLEMLLAGELRARFKGTSEDNLLDVDLYEYSLPESA